MSIVRHRTIELVALNGFVKMSEPAGQPRIDVIAPPISKIPALLKASCEISDPVINHKGKLLDLIFFLHRLNTISVFRILQALQTLLDVFI